MIESGHLCGGAGVHRRYKLGASIASVGIVTINGTAGIIPCTTTDFGDTPGLALETAVYSAVQGDAEGLVTVSVRPDLIVKALVSGGATENTGLTVLVNTAASAGGTVVSAVATGAADMNSGTVFCTKGANAGRSRAITTHTGSTSFTVTVPFPNAIAVNDEFLFVPYGMQGDGAGDGDGVGNVQATTLFTQANGAIASGTGGVATVVDLELNGRFDTAVLFILQDHIFATPTV